MSVSHVSQRNCGDRFSLFTELNAVLRCAAVIGIVAAAVFGFQALYYTSSLVGGMVLGGAVVTATVVLGLIQAAGSFHIP